MAKIFVNFVKTPTVCRKAPPRKSLTVVKTTLALALFSAFTSVVAQAGDLVINQDEKSPSPVPKKLMTTSLSMHKNWDSGITPPSRL